MTENINQHYIPQFILKRFRSPSLGKVYRFRRGETVGKALSVKKSAAEDYYYRDNLDPQRPNSLDDYLNQTESRVGPVIASICDDQNLPDPGSKDFALLIRFVSDMYVRSSSLRAQLAAAGESEEEILQFEMLDRDEKDLVHEALVKLDSGNTEQRYWAEMVRQRVGMSKTLADEAQKLLHARAASTMLPVVISLLNERNWHILVVDSSHPRFIFGDEPIVVHDDTGNVRRGLGRISSLVTFPLSPTTVLQGRYSESDPQVQIVDVSTILKLNWVIARIAYKEVYSCSSDFEWQHQDGPLRTSDDWMKGIPEATWPSNPSYRPT